MLGRFSLEAIDWEDPFEIDAGNAPRLAKHAPFTAEDLADVVAFEPLFFPAREGGPADWLMVGEVPGRPTPVVVPLAKAERPEQCRPIGIYEASGELLRAYLKE